MDILRPLYINWQKAAGPRKERAALRYIVTIGSSMKLAFSGA